MEVCVTGAQAFAGIPVGQVNKSGGFGGANGHDVSVDSNKSEGVGASAEISRFCFEVDCNCNGPLLQPGDWIEVRSDFVLFVDVGKIEYSLCGGTCHGSTGNGLRGVGIGLSISKIRWVIKN
ncbi:MAG TPA: hypothetical protein VHE78_15935 [Gemmatimonadaceae bacterium]|nr:hypothetical protein [Gemmatimonadaceae bacterium]